MDDAREWTATAPRAAAPPAVQPGDPWGAPPWRPDPGSPPGDAGHRGHAPAGITRRAPALLADLVVLGALQGVGGWLAAAFGTLLPRFYAVAQAFNISWQLVVPVAYFALGHGTAGQTPGKRLLGVRVVDRDGAPIGYLHAVGRCVATVVAALPLGLGLLLAALRSDRRGLHDLLAGTRVVRAR
jgi:uncharacterized RDD family membrane protein YckC